MRERKGRKGQKREDGSERRREGGRKKRKKEYHTSYDLAMHTHHSQHKHRHLSRSLLLNIIKKINKIKEARREGARGGEGDYLLLL